MNYGVINTSSLTNVSQELDEFKTGFQTELKKVREAVKNVKDSAGAVVNKIDQQLNIDSILSPVNDFWSDASSQSSEFITKFSNAAQRIDSYATKYAPHVEIGFYVVGGIFILLILVGFILAVLLLHRAFSDNLCDGEPYYSKYCYFFLDISNVCFTFIVENPNVQIGCICSRWSNCFCSVISIPLIIIGAIIVAGLLFALTTMSGIIYHIHFSTISTVWFRRRMHLPIQGRRYKPS